jgi:hypothetical protein
LAGLAASAEQAAALPPGEPVARDATVVPQREVAAWDAAVGPQQEAVAWDAAEEPQQEAASVEAAVPRQVAAGAVRQREARGAAEVLLRAAAPDVRVVQRRAALPSAALWVFHRGQLRRPARPAPQPAARFARAMERLRIASR